jgi:hypothetical protein
MKFDEEAGGVEGNGRKVGSDGRTGEESSKVFPQILPIPQGAGRPCYGRRSERPT